MNLAILNVLKNPLVIAVILGSVFVTNVITYNVVAPASEESELLAFMKAEKAEKKAAWAKVLGKKSRMVDRKPKAPLIERWGWNGTNPSIQP